MSIDLSRKTARAKPPANFLVNTGTDLVAVDGKPFHQIRKADEVRALRRVAARMANNRLQVMAV